MEFKIRFVNQSQLLNMTPEELKDSIAAQTGKTSKVIPQIKSSSKNKFELPPDNKKQSKRAARISSALLHSKKFNPREVLNDSNDLELLNLESRKLFGILVRAYIENGKYIELKEILDDHTEFINRIKKLIE